MLADAFVTWSEAQDARHELLDGVTHVMASERASHSRTKAEIYVAFRREIHERGLSCEAFMDGMAVRVNVDTVFEPDVLVRCGDRADDNTILINDPMIVVEVASPSTQRVDVLIKFARYFDNPHLVHYLIVVPSGRIIIHHQRLANGHIETISHGAGTIVLDPPGLSLNIDAIFSSD